MNTALVCRRIVILSRFRRCKKGSLRRRLRNGSPSVSPVPHETMPGAFITFKVETVDCIGDSLTLWHPGDGISQPYLKLRSAGGLRRDRPRRRFAGRFEAPNASLMRVNRLFVVRLELEHFK
jgi:hypothetical protein